MTTISHTSQISRQATSGSSYGHEGRSGDWDHKLNSLLEDLHGSVVPLNDGKATEYREYRMTSSTRNNDEPPSKTEEKWVEYGTAYQPQPTGAYLASLESRPAAITQSSSSSRNLIDSRNTKTSYSVDDSRYGQTHSHSHSHTPSHMEFLDPSNTTISLRSGQTSPLPPLQTTIRSSPKVEKKEFYSKSSYTTLIKGGEPISDSYVIQDHVMKPYDSQSPQHYPINTRNESEYSRESTKQFAIQEPRYTTPPKVSKPPESPSNAGLKTPPLVRKFLQQSESYGSHSHQKTSQYPPLTQRPAEEPFISKSDRREQIIHSSTFNRERDHIPNYDDTFIDDRNKNIKFYTSTTTRTESKEGSDNIIRRFPSQGSAIDRTGEPPKRLDDLLATFDESYIETSRIVGDGGGPHKSHPYGPGTHSIEQPQRVVRIDESKNVETEISRRNVSHNNNVEHTRNVTGPPVYYPAREDQIYNKNAAEEAELMNMQGKGKAKSKMQRAYKEKEKSKSSHSEKGGGGALPVPVCLPVCCAAPCVIM